MTQLPPLHLTSTSDIKHFSSWLRIVRALQAASCSQQGLAVVKIVIMVNDDGEPIAYSKPKGIILEPKSRKEEFLSALDELGVV
jgi:hypothetical protein